MKIQSPEILGPAGRLEAVLNLPDSTEPPTHAAIVCHPHPLFGGTLHNKVVFHTARALAHLGWPVLRFNYRGVGASQGLLPRPPEASPGANGALIAAAQADLRAALDWLLQRFGNVSVCGAGFSFGSQTVLELATQDVRIERIVAIGVPANIERLSYVLSVVGRLPQPKLFIQGDQDEYGPPESIRKVFDAASEPKRLVMVPGAGHFFDGRLNELRSAVVRIAEPIGELPAA